MINKYKHLLKLAKQEIVMLPQLLGYLFSFKKRAIYVGCTRMGNLGDEAIFDALKTYFGSHFFMYEIPYNNPKAGRLLRNSFMKKPDFIFLGGGTIIKKGGDQSYLKIVNDQIKRYPQAKLAVLGPGVADEDFAAHFGHPIDTKAWKLFLDKCSFVGVRGILSKKKLQNWDVANDIHVFHDPAVCYARKAIVPKAKTKKIGINFAFIGHKIYGENPKIVEEFAKEIVSILIENGWSVYLYPTTKSDMDYMLETIGLKEFEKINIYQNYTDIEKSLDFIESMDIFIGQRLHSIIFAANTYTPFHAIEYEPKTSDFLLTTGFENHATRTNSLDANSVFEKIKLLYESIDYEQEKMFGMVQNAKKEQHICVQQLLSKL